MFPFSPHQKAAGLAVFTSSFLLIINRFYDFSTAYQLLVESHFHHKLQILLMPLADPATSLSRDSRKICQAIG